MAEQAEFERAATKQRGSMDAYMQVLVGLAGTVVLDEKTRNIIFGQVLGHMSAEVARKSARPWEYLTVILLLMVMVLVIYINNVMLQIALGII
jgi:hypothetical protein